MHLLNTASRRAFVVLFVSQLDACITHTIADAETTWCTAAHTLKCKQSQPAGVAPLTFQSPAPLAADADKAVLLLAWGEATGWPLTSRLGPILKADKLASSTTRRYTPAAKGGGTEAQGTVLKHAVDAAHHLNVTLQSVGRIDTQS